ncbi:MAG: CsbD family protein [Collimonas pratensis]|uniref:CsbD family protein n=1 Tax=Collimonas pratensis TaxID=279113 RepID=UPI003C74341B
MSEDRIIGNVKNVAGKIQDAVGNLADDPHMQLEGKARQLAGRTQARYGEAVDNVIGFANNRPLSTLAIAAAIGFFVGVIWSRRK